MDLKIGKNLKNKIMQNKTIQTIVHRKSSSAKKEHNIKRNSLFSKIRSKVSDFRKKISKSTASAQEKGEAIADVIEPITINIECLEGIKTEADFKKGFFKSLCGDKLPESEKDPAAFFARHPELSIRKDVLQDSDIHNITEQLKTPNIATEFTQRFPDSVTASDGTAIQKGTLIVQYMEDINNKLQAKKEDTKKIDSKKETSPQAQAIFEKLQKLKEDTQKVKLDIDIVEKKFDSLKFDARRLNTIKQKLESKKTPLDKVSALATEQLNNIINNLSGSVDFLKKSTQETATDISTLHKTIHETLKKAEKEFENSMKKCDDFMSSEKYQQNTQSTKDILAEHITSLETLEQKQQPLLQFAKTAEDFAEIEFNQDTTNNNAKMRYQKAKEDYTKIDAHKTEIENKLQELRNKQNELNKISEEEILKQHIITASEKLVNILDLPVDDTKNEALFDDVYKSLDKALKDIPDDAGKTQALEKAFGDVQNTLPPHRLFCLIAGLANYKNQIADDKINNAFVPILGQRGHLHNHLKTPPHTINLNTPPNALPEGQIHTLFASNGTDHQAINITKTGTDITISTHDFHDATKNAGTYTLHASQIGDAQNYLNEILKSEKEIYPKFSDIHTTLGKFTIDKAMTPPPPPLPSEDVTPKKLFQKKTLKNYLITGIDKSVDIFTLPENGKKNIELLNDFCESLDNVLKDIPKNERMNTLTNVFHNIKYSLSPLRLNVLIHCLDKSEYKEILDRQDTYMPEIASQAIRQRRTLHSSLTPSPHTINLKNISDIPMSLFASSNTNHQTITITKTGKDITITTHDFHARTKNAGTYTLHASQIKDAQDYLNEILKSEKTTYPKFSDIHTTLEKFTFDKAILSFKLDDVGREIVTILDDYWADDTKQADKATKFNALIPAVRKKDQKTLIEDYITTSSPHPLVQMALHDIIKDKKMTTKIEQRKALQKTLSSGKIEFNKIQHPAFYFGKRKKLNPLLFASDNDGKHLKINLSRDNSGEYSLHYQSFPDDTIKSQTIKIDQSEIINAENYINTLYTKENKEIVDLNDVQKTIQSFSDYITPKDTKTLIPDMINKIHHELYEKDNVIETYWTVSDNPDDAGRKAIDEKFNSLFPNKEIYDDFYTRVQNDGQPLTTLALKYLAHSKWDKEDFHPENAVFVGLLHDGRRKLFDVNNHDGDNIRWNNIFEHKGDAVLLEFHNNAQAKSASDGHYTGALIQKTTENDYKITTINTLREHDNDYILTDNDDIETLMNQIYAKTPRKKNSEGALREQQIQEIKDILGNISTIPEQQIQAINDVLTGSEPKKKFQEIKDILGNAISEETLREIKNILENTTQETNITDIEKILTDAVIAPTQTNRHATQTGSRCGIDMVDRAIAFLKETKDEDIMTGMLNTIHNEKLQRTGPVNYKKYKHLMLSVQAGVELYAQHGNIFSKKPTSFIFKKNNTETIIMTIIPESNTVFELFFIDSSNRQQILRIPRDKNYDGMANKLLDFIKKYSKDITLFGKDPSKFSPPTLSAVEMNELGVLISPLIRCGTADNKTKSYLDVANNYIINKTS